MTVIISGDNGVSDVDGSAGTPAIRGTDANTGIFFPAADTIAFSEGGAEAMRIDSSGNVGIGTSSPIARLQVSGSSGASSAIDANVNNTQSSTNGQITVTGTTYSFSGVGGSTTWFLGDKTVAVGTYGNFPLQFIANGAERARITSGGKFLFNTTTQNGNEQVGMVYSSNAGVGFSIQDSNAQSGNTFIQFKNGATVAGTITSNGTTTMTYGSASDYRLKSNPQPIQNAIATVAALNPVSFTWNQTGEEGVGFIAHEVQAVLPDCVVGQKDAEDENGNPLYQMIDTGSASLIATLTAAIQELKAINDAQASRIETLEAKVAALEAR